MMKIFKPQICFLFLTVFRIVASAWSPWTMWSECSRTCGGGASFARRRCTSTTNDCVGESIRYRTCQNEECPKHSEDFRSLQCAAYNDTEHDGNFYEWIPDEDEGNRPCELHCRARNTNIVMRISPKVFDGTRCYKDSHDMCINGICQPVGCNRELYSNKRFDVCGKCDGDGSSCRLVTGLHRSKPDKSRGTEVVITIPQNSRHISVSERGSGHIGLMLNDSSDFDVIMPNAYQSRRRGIIERSGLVVEYGSLSYGKEYFDVPGPVPKDMQVVAVYDESVWKYIRYEFYRPLVVIWIHDDTSIECTATCGGGLQFIRPVCVEISSGNRRDDKDCHNEGITPPAPRVHRCNTNKCPSSYIEERVPLSFEYMERIRWSTDPWTDCSSSCAGGFQIRTISCAEDTPEGNVLFTSDDGPCYRAGLALPETRRTCNVHPCPRWQAQDWSQCSVTCGSGWQRRTLRCLSHDGQPGFNCNPDETPIVRRACLVQRICIAEDEPVRVTEHPSKPGYEDAAFYIQEVNSLSVEPSWISDVWSDCSTSCGSGVSTRVVKCQAIVAFAGAVEDLDDEMCDGEKPSSTQTCSMGDCVVQTHNDDDVIYGDAYISSAEYDVVDDFSAYNVYDDNSTYTDVTDDLTNVNEFDPEDLHYYEWRFRVHGTCKPSCGNGTQTSVQSCFHIETGTMASLDHCDVATKLDPITLPCDNGPCEQLPLGGNGTRWDLGPFNDCDVMCGRGRQTRSVVCREMPEGGNYTSVSPYNGHLGRTMPDMMCPAPKPQDTQVCSQGACPPKWIPQLWSECSRNCGRGVQNRSLQCMQKLGNGKTVRVSPEHCPKSRPPAKQACNVVHCPPRYIVRQWSECLATCGVSIRTRPIACIQQLAGKFKPRIVPMRRCGGLRRPLAKKACNLKKCVQPRTQPVIISSDEIYVQSRTEAKVRLQVGQRAFILPKTIVTVKCRVEKYNRHNLRWRYNNQPIRSNGGHVTILPDGTLRILRARLSDSGRYTCIAWPATAHFTLRVVTNTSSLLPPDTSTASHLPNPSHNKPKSKLPKKISNHIDNYDDLDTNNSPRVGRPISPGVNAPVPRFRPRPVFLVPTLEPPRLIHPEISFVAAKPVLKVDLRDPSEPDIAGPDPVYDYSDLRPISNQASTLNIGQPDTVLHSILQFMNGATIDPSSDSQVNGLLQQWVEATTSFDQGILHAEERDLIYRDIIRKLNLLLENNELSPRGSIRSVDTGAIERIIRLLEDQTSTGSENGAIGEPASIIPQPTLSPLQLDREVNAYVGGSLIIAGAERITILCETSGTPTPEITWFRDGNKLPDNRRQFILQDGSLRLLYPQFSDAGTYMCVASNIHGNDTQTTALSVTQSPHILSTTQSLEDFTSDVIEVTIGSDIRAKLGSRIKILCPTEGYPDPYVVWRKDGPGLRQNTKVLTDNALEINPATEADQGLFGCEATNPAGSDYQASSLVLIDPPHISDDLNVVPDIDGIIGLPELLMTGTATEEYRVKANSSVMMGCPVTGFPEPQITWFFNDHPLSDMGLVLDYQLMQRGKVLQIPNAGLDTEGTYSCHAQNDGGNLTTRLGLGLIVYSYQFGELTTCSASCGDGGMQYRKLRCMEDGSREVDEWYCTGITRPILTMQMCNRVDCPPRFFPGPWGACSTSCGNGTRTRASSCVILMSDGSTRVVADDACLLNETRRVETEDCFLEKCPQWMPGPWRRCSKKCLGRGVGGKTRKIICVSANGTKMHPKSCSSLPRPRRKSVCPNPRCEPVWVTSSWSVCSKACGVDGIKTRILNCVYQGRKRQAAGNQCSIRSAPRVKFPCNRKPCSAGRQTKRLTSSGRCVNRFRWCPRAKKAGLCKKYKRVCCRSCR